MLRVVTDVVIRGNTFSGDVARGTGENGSGNPGQFHGIWVGECDRVVVEGNEVRDADQAGILVESTCRGEVLVGANTVSGPNVSDTTSPATYGIDVGNTTDPVSVWGNRVQDTLDNLAGAVAVAGAEGLCFVGANVGVAASGAATEVRDTSAGYRADPVKLPVRVATTGSGNIDEDFDDGSMVDGVTLATGDRILLKDQTTGSQNGIWVVQGDGAPVRAVDFDAAWKVPSAVVVFVREGTLNAQRGFVLATEPQFTIGTTALVFAGVVPGTAVAGSSAPGDTAAEGTATTLARSDHRHGRESFSTSVPEALTPGGAVGTATTLSRSDHRHPTTALVRGLVVFTTVVGTPADGADTALQSYTVAAGTLATNGDTLWFEYYGTTKAGTNTKTIQLLFGAAELLSTGMHATANQTATWRLWGHLVRVSNTVVRYGVSLLWIRADGSIESSQQAVNEVTSLNLTTTAYGLVTRGAAGATSTADDVASSTGVVTIGTAT